MLTEQQKIAVKSVDQNVLVSAGAGSGKTHVLVERYVEILRNSPALTVANIVAVTYTKKAASEMRTRLKARFLALSKDQAEVSAGNDMRWLACLSEVDSARIGTIHSLCESIIRAYPADSGIDPEFEVFDELAKDEHARGAVDQALRDVIGEYEAGIDADGKSSWEYALLLAFSIEETQAIIAKLLNLSVQLDQWLESIAELTVPALLARAEKFIEKVKLQELASLSTNRTFKRAFDYVRANPHADPKNQLELSRQHILRLCEDVFAGGGADRLAQIWQALIAIAEYKVGNVGGTKPEAQALRDNLKVLKLTAIDATEKIPLALGADDERAMNLITGIISLYRRAQKIYEATKERLTALDFNDQIKRARRCLEKPHGQARDYFDEKVKALLVDEFQDTNDVQANLLALLGGAERRIFLIGDDKQSIYKFQGADVATFNRWKQSFANQTADLAGKSMVTKLNLSFRSHPQVVAFVNAVFAKLLDGDPSELPYVAAFEALEPARELISPPARVSVAAGASHQQDTIRDSQSGEAAAGDRQAVDVVLFNEDVGGKSEFSADQLEAAHVAHWIKSKVEGRHVIETKGGGSRPIEYGDFAVLVSQNKHFGGFEEVFPRAGIPYVAVGGKGFVRRQEVTDFENLLRFLDNPNDSHSLLAALRSPLCPLTDDLIHEVATSQERERSDQSLPLWTLLTDAANKPMTEDGFGGRPSVKQAVRLLRTILDYASLLPLGELVHKIITLTRYDLVLMVSNDGRQRSRNVWKLAHLARENEHLTCGEFAQKIADMREFGVKESEAPLDASNAVKLMTIHSSKGLEFPAVALPYLGGRLTKAADRLLFHNNYGVAFNTSRLKDVDPVPAWFQVASHYNRKMETEEQKRLLYVAMTRARDCLGVFMQQTVARSEESYRKWLLPHLGLQGHDLSLPEAGRSIELRVPGASRSMHGGGNEESRFALSYWFGFPPLALDAGPVASLPASSVRLDQLTDEPVMNVFDAKINELALVRLTPPAIRHEEEDFAVTSPRVIGTFFHALMENLPQSKKVDRDWVRDIANNQGFHFVHPLRLEAFVDEGMRLLDIYYQSSLRKLIDGSHSRFNEMPYLLGAGDFIATRRPDLILEAGDGQWYLIDYKTDKFHPSQLVNQVRKHSDQLQGYVRDLKQISGIELKAALYFAQTGLFEYIA